MRGPRRVEAGMRSALLALLLSGCATARLTTPPLPPPPPVRGATVLVLEPFFEQAAWQTTTRNEHVVGYPTSPMGYGGMYSPLGPVMGTPYTGLPMTVQREVVDKPAVARVNALTAEHALVQMEIQRMRPSWQVVSTAALQTLNGPVELVRTIVGDQEMVESDRTAKNVACALGLGIPAAFMNIHETQRVQGAMIRYEVNADALRGHLVRYPTQPDFAVDTRGLTPANQPFGLDVSYEEGVLGPDAGHDQVLVNGFAKSLAVAIVAFVEGIKPPQ